MPLKTGVHHIGVGLYLYDKTIIISRPLKIACPYVFMMTMGLFKKSREMELFG